LEQATTFLAVKFESAAIVALLYKAFEVMFSFLFQILIFKEIPSLLSIIGALLISVAIAISGAQKVIENLPEEHHLKESQFLNRFYGTKSSSKQP